MPRALTALGVVEGTAHDGYERFAGIPYAAAPVGPLRFAAPAPPAPFTEPFHADRFAPHAPQLDSLLEQFLSEGAPLVMDEARCLALNVWTPATDGAARPVLVFVHGGTFLWGSSSSPMYSGASLAKDRDVVVVSCNYRLGALGFSSVAALGGPAYESSGNSGLQDVIAALRWVQTNVAAFGGSPENVTVFGESAGAMCIGTLLGCPSAKGLFHKAILQSGAASNVASAARSSQLFDELAARLGGPPSIDELQSIPLEQLLAAQQSMALAYRDKGLAFAPVVDGHLVPAPPLDAVVAGAAIDVPLLIGTNLDEWRLFSATDPDLWSVDEPALEARVASQLGGDPRKAIDTYRRRLGDAPPKLVLDCVGTDVTFRAPAVRLAEAQVHAGGNAHMYLFTWPSTAFGGALGSFHGLELPFVFNTLATPSASVICGDAAPPALSEAIQAAWVAFARTGDPSGGTLGSWPHYRLAERTTMVLDATPHLEDDPLADERLLWPD